MPGRTKHSAVRLIPTKRSPKHDLIRPVLELLGWTDYLPQQGTAGKEDIPDHLLFADAGSKERATAERNPGARARYAIALEESKRFGPCGRLLVGVDGVPLNEFLTGTAGEWFEETWA